MKILVIDGHGGKMGASLVEQICASFPGHEVIAIGSNTLATSAMLRAGAHAGATGENPVVLGCADADIIVGPIGITIPNTLLGEITPAIATAVATSRAHKVLLPVSKCNHTIVGVSEKSLGDYVKLAIARIGELLQ